jgi:hypothetical protein
MARVLNSVAISSLDGEVGVSRFATQVVETNLMLRTGTLDDNVDEIRMGSRWPVIDCTVQQSLG